MTDRLKPLEVKTINIASKAVTADKIAEKAVENRHIKDGAVTPDKMSITPAARPLTPPVDTAEIKDGAITPQKLSFSTVSRPLNPPIGTDEIRDGAVTKAKMADGTIGTAEIIDGSVTTPKLASSSVTSAKIAAAAVRGTEIADGVVSAAKLSTDAVETAKIKDGAVTPSKLSFTPASRPLVPPVATDEIANLSVTYDKIANYSVNDEKLSAGAITTPKVGDSQITNAKLQDASITPPKVDAVNSPTDGQALTYEQASGRFKYATPGGGGSRITLINPQTVFDETSTSDRSAPLSSATVVPVTAVGVLVELHQDGMIPSWAQPSAQIQHPLGGVALTCYITGDAAGTHPHYADNAGIVPVYAPQQIYLVINRVGVTTRVKVTVTGYIE